MNIPVQLFNTVSRKTVRFNQLDETNHQRIRHRKVNADTGDEVPDERIVKGYELSKNNYVIIGEDELASLDPEAQRTIDIERFVDLGDIDPVLFDNSYVLGPDPATVKAYALLTMAMAEQGKVAIARFVMRSKQYLAAIRATDGRLVLSTLVYADELNAVDEIPGLDQVGEIDVDDKELALANQLIGSLEAEWAHEDFADTYRDQVMDLISRKADGEQGIVTTPDLAEPAKVVDLMAALEASVAEAKETRKKKAS